MGNSSGGDGREKISIEPNLNFNSFHYCPRPLLRQSRISWLVLVSLECKARSNVAYNPIHPAMSPVLTLGESQWYVSMHFVVILPSTFVS